MTSVSAWLVLPVVSDVISGISPLSSRFPSFRFGLLVVTWLRSLGSLEVAVRWGRYGTYEKLHD